MSSAAVITGVVAAGTAAYQASAAEDAEDREYAANQARLNISKQDRKRLERLIRKLPQQERESTANLLQTYAKQRENVKEAKIRGDQSAAQLFDVHTAQVKEALKLQFAKLGQDHGEFLAEINGLQDKYSDELKKDQRINALNKKIYEDQTAQGFQLIKDGNDAFQKQVAFIKETGFDKKSAGIIAEAEEKANQIKRQTANIEAQIGKGGSGSREAATAFEAIRTIAGVKQAASDASDDTLAKAADFAKVGEMLAGRRTEVLRATEGQEQIALDSKFDEAKLAANEEFRGQRTAIELGGQQQQQILERERLNTQNLRDEGLIRELGALDTAEAAGKEALVERTQNLERSLTAGVVEQGRSLADVYGNMARSENVRANTLNQQAQASFASLGSMLASSSIFDKKPTATPDPNAIPKNTNGTIKDSAFSLNYRP